VSAAFGTLLEQGLRDAALSQNRLAKLAAVDPAYVNRLVRHRQAPPSRAVALRFADALELDPDETDRFLRAAGHAPVEDWQTRAKVAEAKLAAIALALGSTEHPVALPSRKFG
jgi:transcriptional regulator with XRE-family HTH domain